MGREAYLKYKGKDFAVNVEDDETSSRIKEL